MSHMAAASRSLSFESEYKNLDPDFRQALSNIDFEGVMLWNNFSEHAPGTDEHQLECRQLAEELGAKGAKAEAWAAQAAKLRLCARDQAGAVLQRMARVDGRLSLDR